MGKPNTQTDLTEDVGKLLLDVGKMVVGGIIIGGILRGEVNRNILITSGVMVAVVCFISGFILIAHNRKKKRGDIC